MRASSVTRGWAACRSRSTIEIAAPSSTPLTGPDPSTPTSAAIATKNSVRLNRQMCRRAWMSTRPMTAARTIAASTGCGRFRSSPDANSDDDQREGRGDQSRQRRARAGALVDERLRHAATDREPAAEPRQRDWQRQWPATPDWPGTGCRASGRTCDRWPMSPPRRGRSSQGLSGRSAFSSCRLTSGQPERRQTLGNLTQERDARSPRGRILAPRACRRSPRGMPLADASARACRR